ncbi:MAG: AzlD domain-containing protein [Oscillospiraceae bacterium]
MKIVLLILGMALVTYIPRALPAVVMDKLHLGAKVEKFLGLIPYTAMAALIFPGILYVDSERWYIGVIGGGAAILLALSKKMPLAVTVLVSIAAVMLTYLAL